MIELGLPPKVLSPNVRAHWAVKARATREYRLNCGFWFALMRKGRPRATGPLVIDVEYRCSRGADGYIARDIQNAIAAMKAGIDGMVDAGVVVDDSKKYLRWGRFDLVTRKHARGDGVTVTVRPL